MAMPSGDFEIICEIEPATRPDVMHVRHQIGVLSRVANAFLIPDNHIGRAPVQHGVNDSGFVITNESYVGPLTFFGGRQLRWLINLRPSLLANQAIYEARVPP